MSDHHSTAAVFGDVTSLTLATLPHATDINDTTTEILLGATGSQLHVFLLPDCHLFSQTVLPNAARCHGIATCTLPATPQTAPVTLVAVHGDRHVNVYSLDPLQLSNQLALVASLPRLGSWTMAIDICSFSASVEEGEEVDGISSGNAMVTVGLSDNSVEFYEINTSSRRRENNYSAPDGGGGGVGGGGGKVELIKRVVCTDRCLLYSMNLHLDTTNRVCYVAGGTIFLDVVVWKAKIKKLDSTTSNGNGGGGGGDDDLSSSSSSYCESFSDVLYRLKGHEGSIHSVRWSPSGTVLASGSDDRTVRIWDIILENKNYFKIEDEKEVSLCPRKVLYGHSARLWGFCFTQDESIVISCSEDRTCKFWNILETKEKKEESYFASLKAHRYRGVWHCCLQGSILYTGGADGAIKAWNLWDVLQPEYVERILKSSSCSLMAAATAPPLLLPRPALSNGNGVSSSLSGVEEDVHNGCSWVATSLQCDLPDSESTTVGTITAPAAGAAAAAVVVEQQIQSSSSSSSSDATKKVVKTAVDSSSEWVRCLAITKDHSTLFVATNRGLVHQVQLPAVPLQPLPTSTQPTAGAMTEEGSGKQEEQWLTIYKSERKRPITSIKLVEHHSDGGNGARKGASGSGAQGVVYVSLCDIFGYSTVLTAPQRRQQHQAGSSGDAGEWSVLEWLPYNSQLVSGIHFLSMDLKNNLVFTTGPQGTLTLWQLELPLATTTDATAPTSTPTSPAAPVNLAESCCELKKSTQIVEIDTLLISDSTDNTTNSTWLVAAGTSCGAIVIWQLKKSTKRTEEEEGGCVSPQFFELQRLSQVKDVHLGSPIRSISLISNTTTDSTTSNGSTIVLESCGSNGAIVRFSVSTNGTLSIMVEEHYDALLVVSGKVAVGSKNINYSPSLSPSPLPPPPAPASLLVYGFQSTNFVLWDAKAEAEVCSVPCGSWRRPWAVQISAADVVTFCCDRGAGGTKLSLYTRRPVVLPSGEVGKVNRIEPFPRALLPPGHGREINAIGIRRKSSGGGSGCGSDSFASFTGGEDSSVYQTVVNFSKNPSLREISFISDHVGGTTVKSLTMVDFFGSTGSAAVEPSEVLKKKKTLLVTGGSKKVLMAWIIYENDDLTADFEYSSARSAAATPSQDGFHCQFLSSHAVQNIISCKNLPSGKPISQIENRYLAISAIVSSSSSTRAFILCGCSNGPAELRSIPLDLSENTQKEEGGRKTTSFVGTWPLVALLQYHTCPVISTQTLHPSFASKGECTSRSYVAFTAGTDGACAVWDLSFCIEGYLAAVTQHSGKQQQGQTSADTWETVTIPPISIINNVHQSGINGMSAAQVVNNSNKNDDGGPAPAAAAHAEVMVVTVGDDQGLTASLVNLTQSNSEEGLLSDNMKSMTISTTAAASPPPAPLSTLECTLSAQVKEPNAHSSAARDVWTDGHVAFSTGIDQKVRRWQIERIYHAEKKDSNGGGSGSDSNIDATTRSDVEDETVSLRITETGCVVTQVLEPLTLDVAVVTTSENNITAKAEEEVEAAVVVKHKVAVGGRGMQVIEW